MANKLFYYWRLVATGWCFLSFSLGGLLLAVAVFPPILLINMFLPGGPKKYHKAQSIIHYSFRLFIKQMVVLGIMTVQVKGLEKLDSNRPKLILANHPTLIDVVLLISLVKHTNCVVKKALWRDPFLSGVVRAAGYISNDGTDALIDDCVDALKSGDNLIIFPEGTRTVPGQDLKFQRGAAHIAARSAVEIVPVTITCTPPTLSKAEKWYHIPPRMFALKAEVGDPIDISAMMGKDEPLTLVSRRLTRFLHDYFTERLNDFGIA